MRSNIQTTGHIGKYLLTGLLTLLLTAVQKTYAQYTITGRIVNAADQKPVKAASVFISNATIGDVTDNEGNFALHRLRPGKYTMVVSAIGFDPYTQDILINNSSIKLPDIKLNVRVTVLSEVKITGAEKNKSAYYDWSYQVFCKEFLGTSSNAKSCKILNPEVLSLDYDPNANEITASSSDYLQIENDALGYTIQYQLSNFKLINDTINKEIHYNGNVLFTPMKGSAKQQKRWDENRKAAYEGSTTHFMRSLLADNLVSDGFKVLRIGKYSEGLPEEIIDIKLQFFKNDKSPGAKDSLAYWKKMKKQAKVYLTVFPNELGRRDLVTGTSESALFNVGCDNDQLLVMYDHYHDFPQTSQLTDVTNLNFLLDKATNNTLTLLSFTDPFIMIDSKGGIINPNGVAMTGSWVKSRIGDLLPVDYDEHPADPSEQDIKPDTVLQYAVNRLNNHVAIDPDEKVYLHLDRDTYMPGDTIWFKAYAVSGVQHSLSSLSGILYCELRNEKDSVVARRIMKLVNGLTWGDMDIPLTVTRGGYHICAYTSWMTGTDMSAAYNQPITLLGGRRFIAAMHAKPAKDTIDVQFFPEGGNLITGVRSKVAVKAVNARGLGEDVRVQVTDNGNNKIADMVTRHLGMGAFDMIPVAGKTYKAIVTCKDSSTYTFSLPPAQSNGFVLSLDNTGRDTLRINVLANDEMFAKNRTPVVYLLGQINGKTYYTKTVSLNKPVTGLTVSKNNLPSGILQLTLLSQNGEALNERIAFIRTNDTTAIHLSSQARTYQARQKVTIDMDAVTGQKTLPGNYSVSVINEDRTAGNENIAGSIFSDLLLTSDLKGYVEQPGYYFSHPNAKTDADLDLLMLTQGYRRFEWKHLLSSPASATKFDDHLSLTGTVKKRNGNAEPFARVTLLSTINNFVVDTVTDAKGNFAFKGLDFPDSTLLIIKAKPAHSEKGDLRISVNKQTQGIPKTTLPALNMNMQNAGNQLSDHAIRMKDDSLLKGRILKQVNIKVHIKPAPDLSSSSNLNGPGHADQVIMGDDLSNCITLEDCLTGRVRGVKFEGGYAYNTRDLASISNVGGAVGSVGPRPAPMTIIVDNFVADHFNFDFIHPSDIYSIEIIRSGAYEAIYGSEAFRGAIIITMRHGGENSNKNHNTPTAAGLTTYLFNGYYKTTSFYSPKYIHPRTTAELPDARTTIYWNPNVVTDKNGKASFEYYNADTKGTYRVIVEGIDVYGNLGRQVYRYKVQ